MTGRCPIFPWRIIPMFGPKLDSRSYTTLLLVVIASLLTINLFAQLGTRSERTMASREYNLNEADPGGAVADATLEVAEANRQIAAAIDALAGAVSRLELTVHTGAGAPGQAPVASSAPAEEEFSVQWTEDEETDTMTGESAPEEAEGTFNVSD